MSDALNTATFAVGQHFPHHTADVVKPTENKSVDLESLKTALADVNKSGLPQAERLTALDHLKAHAVALDLADEEIASLIGDEPTAPDFMAQLGDATTFGEAETVMLAMAEANVDEALLDEAEAKLAELAAVDREMIEDEFSGIIEKVDKDEDEDGLWHFTARVAQANTVNKNKRLYPRSEFERNLARMNRMAKAGRLTGRDGHVFWGDDKPSEICVRYDAVMLQGDDLIMEGVLIPTQAGENIGTLWANGVQTEWSIVGYGKAVEQTDDKGNITHVVVTDYIMDGCDPVRRGAASTRTLKQKKSRDSLEVESEVDEAVQAEVGTNEEVPVAESLASVPEVSHMADEVVTQKEPQAPVVDVEAIKAAAIADAKEVTKSIVADALLQAKLETAKDAALAKLAEGDEMVAKIVAKHLADCDTPEKVAETVAEITPLVERMKTPKPVETSGVFIHEGRERARFMFAGEKVVDRPETIGGVRDAMLEGLEGHKAEAMRQILDNYEKQPELKRYLYSMTKRGYQETASTTSALGSTIPMVLPIIRQLLPKLIPYALAAVRPIDRPEARVYFYEPKYKTGTNGSGADGSYIDDSSVFDTAWDDHTENDTKSQIEFTFTYQTVTATEKAIYWDYTSALAQDMQAYYSMDVEAEMMATATNLIAMELNGKFLETLASGAGQSGTFNTGLPATGFQNLNDWLTWGLSQSLNRASGNIGKKMGQRANWIITGPTQATLFEASNSYQKLPAGAVTEFGTGLRQVGSWSSLFDVYVFDWAETLSGLKNKMLIGYQPQDWNHAAAVFCPYVPLYISPVSSSAATNTIQHSVASRNAMKVLQSNGLYALTIGSDAGTALTYVD